MQVLGVITAEELKEITRATSFILLSILSLEDMLRNAMILNVLGSGRFLVCSSLRLDECASVSLSL